MMKIKLKLAFLNIYAILFLLDNALVKRISSQRTVTTPATIFANEFEEDAAKNFRVTLNDFLTNAVWNDTKTTASATTYFLDGQKLSTRTPSSKTTRNKVYVTQTITAATIPTTIESETTAPPKEVQQVQGSENVSLYGLKGPTLTRTSPAVAAVYEDGNVLGHREDSVTSTPLLAQYSDIPILLSQGSGGREHSTQICDFCLYEGEGNFTSYGYPLNYRPNLNCTYRIMRLEQDDSCEVELYFHDFDVPVTSLPSTVFQSSRNGKKESECREDYLEVNGKRYCGPSWKGKSEMISFPTDQRELVFRFVSNDKKPARGFWAEVTRRPGSCYGKRINKPSQACEERFSEMDFDLKSPQYPLNYPMNADCAFYIRKMNEDVCALEMTFNKFDVELSQECVYDYIEIDGQKMCGSLPEGAQKIFKFEEDQKLLSFVSDAQTAKSGFNIRMRQITDCRTTTPSLPAPPSCNVCTSEGSGALVSYGYPDHYRNNLLCTYTIDKRNSDYCQVELDFQDFDLEQTDNCITDYLQLEGKRYCGDSLKSLKRVISFDNKDRSIVLVFKTDARNTKKGFLIQYKQLECGVNDLIPEKASSVGIGTAVTPDFNYQQCDYVYTDSEFVLKNENYGQNYANNMDCTYYIKKNNSRVCYLEFTFMSFDVEASPECQYDYLEVGNTVRLCGTLQTETMRTYIFDTSEKVIRFHSDSSTNRGGYYIKIEQLECEGDKIVRRTHIPASSVSSSGASTQGQPVYTPSSGLQSTYPSYTTPSYSQEANQCNQLFDLQESTIVSPGYPSPYSPLNDCTYTIKKLHPSICKLDIIFYDFEVQPSDPAGYCKYDYVDFNGVKSCGEIIKGAARNYYFPDETFVIHFHSDNSVTSSDRGFRLGIKQLDCDLPARIPQVSSDARVSHTPEPTCDKMITDVVFELKSPYYPENYPNNANCKYTIMKETSRLRVCQLEVNFIDMNLKADDECKDYIDFNGQLMCGSLPSETTRYYPFDGEDFVITFGSDAYSNDRGFFLRVRQKECPPDTYGADHSIGLHYQLGQLGNGLAQCGGTFSDTSFELRSPQYPAYYENNLECLYTIKRKNEKICRIELRIIDFDVQPSTDCLYDYLKIDGQRFCGDMKVNHMKTFQFYEGEKILEFKSDALENHRGFLIKGQQKECEFTPKGHVQELPPESVNIISSIPSVCELCFTEVMGTFQSYDFPNNYPPNLNCKYKITALPGQCMVQLNFDEFNLEPPTAEGCESDYLEINSVKYCGRQLERATQVLTFYNTNPKELTIRFVSNGRTSSKGFRASYTQLPCPSEALSLSTPQKSHSRHPVGVASSGSYPIHVVDKPLTSKDGYARVPCDLVLYDMQFDLVSPNYPSSYPHNSDCLYSVRRANYQICKLRLHFMHFDLGGKTKDCSEDYLDIGGHRLCGNLPNNTIKEFDFRQYKTSLRFRSDYTSGSYENGFMIHGEQIDCANEQTQPQSDNQYSPQMYSYNQQQQQAQSRFSSPQSQQTFQPAPGGFMLPPVSYSQPAQPAPAPAPSSNYPARPTSSFQSPPVAKHDPYYQKQSARPQIAPLRLPPMTMMTPAAQPKSQTLIQSSGNQYSQRTQVSPTRYGRPSITPLSLSTFGSIAPIPFRNNVHVKGQAISITTNVGSSSSSYSPPSGSSSYSPQAGSSSSFSPQAGSSYSSQSGSSSSSYSPQMPNSMQIDHRSSVPSPQAFSPPMTGYSNQMGSSVYSSSSGSSSDRTKPAQCEQLIDSLYFEIKSPPSPQSQCMYTIHKMKENVCQIDIMFETFNMGDPTCNTEYLSIDGERLCGMVPRNTIRTYKFDQNDMQIYMRSQSSNGKEFKLKGRQVECNGNAFQTSNQLLDKNLPPAQSYSSRMQYNPPSSSPLSPQASMPSMPQMAYKQQSYPSSQTSSLQSVPSDGRISAHIHVSAPISQDPSRIQIRGYGPGSSGAFSQPKMSSSYSAPPNPPPMQMFTPMRDGYMSSRRVSSAQTYSYVADNQCNKMYSSMEFSVTSPNFPNNYGENLNCMFTIRQANPNVCAIDMQFESFNIEDDPKCGKDYLEVDAGRICGILPPSHERRYYFLPDEYEKVLIFNSDSSGSKPGFSIKVKQITDCSEPWKPAAPAPPTVCDVCSHGMRGHITSSNYPSKYGDFTKCSYRIQAAGPQMCQVRIYIRDLDIEQSTDCDKDALMIANERICGDNPSTRDMILNFPQDEPREIQFNFQTDGKGAGRGFYLEYNQEQCPPSRASSLAVPLTPVGSVSNLPSSDSVFGPLPLNGRDASFPKQTDARSNNPSDLIAPIYPPNYVSRAHIEEIVQTQVNVVDRRNNSTSTKN